MSPVLRKRLYHIPVYMHISHINIAQALLTLRIIQFLYRVS